MADQETAALRRIFAAKRSFAAKSCTQMGLYVFPASAGMYLWVSVRHLPAPLNTAWGFFWACVDESVLVIPGEYFDIQPHPLGLSLNKQEDNMIGGDGIAMRSILQLIQGRSGNEKFRKTQSPGKRLVDCLRISLGPNLETLKTGMARLEKVIKLAEGKVCATEGKTSL
jgi:hypothetical protein